MKKLLIFLILSTILTTGCQKQEDSEETLAIQDHPEVELVLNNYMKGTYEGDVELLRSTFHPEATMSGYMGDELIIGDPEPFFADIEKNPSMSSQNMKYKGEIKKLQVNGNIADAIIYEIGFYGEQSFENHFHLLKDTDGKWKIISKCFTTLN